MRTAIAIMFLMLAGCVMPRAGAPLTQSVHGNDTRSRLMYQRQITDRRICGNDDAFHLLIQYTNQGVDPCGDYARRVQWLDARRMLPDHFDRPADEAVTRGTMAVAIARMLNIKGGIVMHLLPQSERYATRELVYRGIYPPDSSPQQTYSGIEVIGVLAKMEDFQLGDPANLRASQMPAAPATQEAAQ
jgi:hypothetical protein